MAEQNKWILKEFLNKLIEKFNGHRSDISSEDVLEQFMAWAEARGTTLYPAQEEAILEMNLLGHEFFVYKDMHTNNVNVLYKRKDGNYGLIETK